MWDEVWDRLDPERYTLHRFDFRGCGLSDRPRDGHDFDGYASDLRRMLASIDAPTTLVGHSMGARLAQYIATEHPSNLERMILVAPGTARAATPSAKHRALTLAAYGSRERIERFQRGAMAHEVAPEVMRRLVDDALIAQYEHWFGWYERGRELDFRDRLQAVAVPTLAIAGSKDPIASAPRVKTDVVQAIAGAVFVLLRSAGHNIPVEVPNDVVEAIARFI